jgi:hypothetical protein
MMMQRGVAISTLVMMVNRAYDESQFFATSGKGWKIFFRVCRVVTKYFDSNFFLIKYFDSNFFNKFFLI